MANYPPEFGLSAKDFAVKGASNMERRAYLVRNLRQYRTLAELQGSAFFSDSRTEIEAILGAPEVWRCPSARPLVNSFVRVAQWNIEKGKRVREVIDFFWNDPILRWADVILLNEVDHGMSRSGNRNVARILAEAFEMNMAFAPAHLELTKGTDEDLDAAGENAESLQGNAVLSRYPIEEAMAVALPVCFEPFEFTEKRYGTRNCVWTRLQVGLTKLWVGSVHLEVRKTPRCRAVQMRHLLQNVPGGRDVACLIGGDLNANGFGRGTLLRTIASTLRLLVHRAAVISNECRHPELGREPLFQSARRAGFFWQGLNSDEATACAPIGNIEDAGMLPRFIVRMVQKRLTAYKGHLSFKLDWFLGRGLRGLSGGEICDALSGIRSVDPGCVVTVRRGFDRISDHSPIYADISL